MGTAVAVVLITSGLHAKADETGDPSKTEGIQKFEDGLKAMAAGDTYAALAAFDASNSLLPSPNSELYIARCYLALGQVASAHAMFLRAAAHAEERLAANDHRYVATRDSAKKEAASIESDVPTLAIMLPSDAGTALVVKKNGAVVNATPNPVETDPGHIAIDITGPRLVPFHAELDLAKGESRRVDVNLEHVPTAIVNVKLPPLRPEALEVRIAGESVATAELAMPHAVNPGACVVDATAPGYQSFHWNKACVDDESVDVDVHLERVERRTIASAQEGSRWMRPAAYAIGAAGLLAIGVGSYFGVRAKLTDNDADRDCPTITTCNGRGVELGHDAHDQARASSIAFVTGGALLAVGVFAYFVSPKQRSVSVSRLGGVW